MPATTTLPQAGSTRPSAAPVAPPAGYSPIETAAPPARRCRHCCVDVPREARKCRACGEWLVRTSAGPAAALLRLLGWTWAGLSALAAATLWYVGAAIREHLLLSAADEYLTPLGLDLAVYAIVGMVLLQGLTFGVALNVLAATVPRRPRWWT